ncbi:hypothetical protein ACLOJK_012152 [Asimina triloba]
MAAEQNGSIFQLFRFADRVDKCLMLVGTIGCIGDGLMTPLTLWVMSSIINKYGASDADVSLDAVNKVRAAAAAALELLHSSYCMWPSVLDLALLLVSEYLQSTIISSAYMTCFDVVVETMMIAEGVCWTRSAERQTSRMRREYLKSVLRQDVGFFDTNAATSTTYEVVAAITADSNVIQDVMSDKIPNFISNIVTFIFTTVVALILEWRLALASLPICLFFIIPGVVFGKFMMDLAMMMKEAYGVAGGIAEQAISSIRTVVSYVAERQTLERFSHALVRNRELGIKQGLMKGLAIGSIGILFAMWSFQSWVGSVLVTEAGAKGGSVFISGLCILYGGLPLISLSASKTANVPKISVMRQPSGCRLHLLLQRWFVCAISETVTFCIDAFRSIMSALPNSSYFAAAVAAAIRIFEMIDRHPTIDIEDENGIVLDNLRGEIEFKDVEFTYPSRPDSPVLQGLNLRVLPGKTVGLVGGSGSGKSTTIALLERFYEPTSGDIYLDRKNIKRLQLKWLRSQMGLVSQEPVLFATTIKENILFGNETASMELVVSAAEAANAHDFITKLPDGYFTHVGQFGFQMSGGQKQRIAIARALLKDPKILLLDEATSALDAQSERVVQDALDQASVGRTTIIIAHRLSTLRKADMIAVVQSGKVVELGSHDQLMQLNDGGGAYAKMVQMQQTAMTNEAADPSQTPGWYNHNSTSMMSPSQTPSRYTNMLSPSQTPGRYTSMISPSQTPTRYNYKNTNMMSPSQTPSRYNYKHTSMMSPVSGRSTSHAMSPAVSFVQMGSPALPFVQATTPIIASPYVHDQHRSDPSETTTMKSSSAPSQWRLLRMNASEWRSTLLGCFGAISFGAAQPIHFYCMGSMLSVYFISDPQRLKDEARFYCYMFFGVGMFCVLANVIQHYNFAIMGERLTKRVREKMLEKLLTFEVGWFDRDENNSAAICARLASEANMVRSLVGERMSLLLQVTATASFSFALGIAVSWRLGSVIIAMQPLIIGCFYSRSVLMQKMSARAQKAQNEGSQLASEAVVNHKTITAFSSQGRVLGLYENALEGPRKENVRQSLLAGVGLFVSQFFTTASIALSYWYGGKLLMQGLITPKHLFQAFFILVSTGKVIADAGTMTNDLSKGSSAVRSVFEVLDRKSEIEPDAAQGIAVKKKIKGHVELKNVHFAYPSRPDQMIFRGLSLVIEAAKQVALVGPSGSGKSTVIGLIERFYDPLKGSVGIDGREIKSYNLRTLRAHIALVSQEPTLFSGTIRDNIAYGRENATESEIMEAAALANAHDFISSMKDGYDTNCGERGTQLSGGQKQRIALARAILKNPSILLLDEATSALDTVSESLVQAALDKMMVGRTCMVVAHRLSTIQKSESIAVIKNGKIVEQGSHSELLEKGPGGTYYALIRLQKGSSNA